MVGEGQQSTQSSSVISATVVVVVAAVKVEVGVAIGVLSLLAEAPLHLRQPSNETEYHVSLSGSLLV